MSATEKEIDPQRLKNLSVKLASVLHRKYPGLLDYGFNCLPKLVDARFLQLIPPDASKEPFESLKNLEFALKLVLKVNGEEVTRDKLSFLAKETVANFLSFYREILEAFEAVNSGREIPVPDFVKPELPAEVKDFFEQDKGIIVSLHSGNPLAAAKFFTEIFSQDGAKPKRLGVLMEKQPGRIQDPMLNLLASFGIQPIPIDQQISMLKEVHKSDFLFTLFDRPSQERNGIGVNFLGEPALFPQGMARFADKLQRRVLPAVVVRKEGSYALEFGQVVSPCDYRKITDDLQRQQAITQNVVSALETIALKYPTSVYSWFEPLWLAQKSRVA